MSNIIPFDFQDTPVRAIYIGEIPWFIAADICTALGYANTTKAIQDHTDEDERSNVSLGRQGKMNIINESGLYSLILRSKKAEAKKFKKWVTSEVLPVIRKYGFYSSPADKLEAIEEDSLIGGCLLNCRWL